MLLELNNFGTHPQAALFVFDCCSLQAGSPAHPSSSPASREQSCHQSTQQQPRPAAATAAAEAANQHPQRRTACVFLLRDCWGGTISSLRPGAGLMVRRRHLKLKCSNAKENRGSTPARAPLQGEVRLKFCVSSAAWPQLCVTNMLCCCASCAPRSLCWGLRFLVP